MISDEVWDRVREAWFAAIPLQYRNDGKERLNSVNQGDRHISSRIILGPPPKPILDRWFANCERHLTADQLKAKAARESMSRPGVKKGDSWSPRRRERARAKPSLPSVPAEMCRMLPGSLPNWR
jgi:hypothetical protein